ncbi:MAG TPA: NADP-dependent oxidoreductase [Actinomycetales bacterium]|nr:NADP-dependent oxidoreductase [Actinomycetales bacterium]
MRALRYSEYGGPEVLSVGEAPEPHAGPGQVRVAVRAASVNPADHKIRSGLMGGDPAALPRITGLDGAGVVDEVGPGVESVAVGDEVLGVGSATAAELAVLDLFTAKPASMTWEEAAALPLAAETAARALDLLGVGVGTTLLVEGAAGGVGSAAVQLAVARGANVIGTASERNHEYLRRLGAVPTTYGEGLVERVRKLAPQGVDAVLDTAGKGSVPQLVQLVDEPAQVVSIADFNAPQHGARVTSGGKERAGYALGEAVRLHGEGRYAVEVERTFPLADGAEAHRVSEGGHVRGKLVLLVGQG